MKKAILATAAVLMMLGAMAQGKWGVIAGANFSTLKFPDNTSLEDAYKTKTGFNVGLTYDAKLIGGLHLNTGLMYVQRNVEEDTESGSTTNKASSLELPVNLKLNLPVPVVHPFLIAGPYLDCGLGTNGNYDYGDQLKRFNYGLAMGFGVDVIKTIRVMYQYDLGLSTLNTSVEDAFNSDAKNRGHRVSVGILF